MPITVETGGPLGGTDDPTVVVEATSVLGIVQEACKTIGITVPTSLYGSTARENVELAALANEMAERIALDTHDWSVLKQVGTVLGDGEAESFAMPPGFGRMLRTARAWPSDMPNTPLEHVLDSDEWLGLVMQEFQLAVPAWTVIGSEIYIRPTLADQQSVSFFYLSRLYALDGNTRRSNFGKDSDKFRLDPRLLKLGIIWQWKANKGFSYQEDMATYEDALAFRIGSDKGSRKLTVGRSRWPGDVGVAYPGVLGQ